MHSTLVSVATVLCLSLIPVHASDLLTGLKLVNGSLAGYINEGCYTEATSGRALAGLSYNNDSMTVEVCAASCSDFIWFGGEWFLSSDPIAQLIRVQWNTDANVTVATHSTLEVSRLHQQTVPLLAQGMRRNSVAGVDD